ncbi:hypothetical protein JCM19235_1924 [Vibrio maritimus]|uniref:Uncharacterized protein n=1 Tax=Vibrio maritimus TaxID=990268 RepID=A0A090RTC6_9VIBR|nr:hypothetical protein JCM19235_1924 [Vibrio maritimus]
MSQRFELLEWWSDYVEAAAMGKVSLSLTALRMQSQIPH